MDDHIEVFQNRNSTKEQIEDAGVKLFKHLYRILNHTLGGHRFKKFPKTAAAGAIKPEILPPTTSAAKQHSLRTYRQLWDWLQL